MRSLKLTPDLLRRVDSLRELDDEALREFAAEATGTQRSKEKDPEIVSHMDNSRDVYFIIEGMVRVDMFHTNGMRITFQILTEGEMFGELAAIDGLERSARVIAEEEVKLASLSQPRFHAFMQKHALFARQVMLRLSRLSRHLMERSKLYAVTKVRGRVYAILLEMHATQTAKHDSDLIVPLPTDDDIASRAGTGRSYVNLVISQLGSKKIVEKRSDGWKILDLPALELLSQEAQAD